LEGMKEMERRRTRRRELTESMQKGTGGRDRRGEMNEGSRGRE